MPEMKLAVVESHFADIIWKNEPIPARELAKICEQELSWKRTTNYTVLKSSVSEAFSRITTVS